MSTYRAGERRVRGAGVPPLDAFTGFLHRLRKSFEIQHFIGRKLENEVKIGKSYL